MNRRDFVNRLASVIGVSALNPIFASAQAGPNGALPASNGPPRQLGVVNRLIEINGKAAKVFGLAQPDGTPGLVLGAGDSFDVALTNSIDAPTLIHWHGLTPPWPMDGVPDNPAAPLAPSETRRYAFPVGRGGTHWMHARRAWAIWRPPSWST
jgi:FtsP/CotA-like multicopper oxidase with cupredoxin domain